MTVTLPGQVIVGWTGVRVSLTVTVKLHAPPLWVPQLTTVVPTGKADSEGGLQVTSLSGGLPQAPEIVGVEKDTTALH